MILPNKGKDGDSTFEETLLCKLSLLLHHHRTVAFHPFTSWVQGVWK